MEDKNKIILEDNYKIFKKYNSDKLAKTYATLKEDKKTILKAISILLHINQRNIPGYIDSQNVPFGIKNFKLTDKLKKYFYKIFSKSIKDKSLPDNPCIESLALMGSIGSIAQTKFSDFDYWVCINENDLQTEQINLLRQKLEQIEKWLIIEKKLEVHFFIVDILKAKNNDFGFSDSESCGSAQGQLLKDEFFRSSIIVEGKVPFWWITTSDTTDKNYNFLWENTVPLIQENSFIDIGNLINISKNEFVGAALWQLVKSLSNPFKSFIKMALLELYLFSEEDKPLLSCELKDIVLTNNYDTPEIDPYILLFNNVYDFYNQNEKYCDKLELLKICFYLKIKPEISKFFSSLYAKDKKYLKYIPEKVNILNRYVKKWNWGKDKILELDNYENWPYTKLKEQNNMLKKYLLDSFKILSTSFNLNDVKSKITDRDFTVITRKLLSFYSQTPNKLMYFPISLQDKTYESILNLVYNEKNGNKLWQIYRGNLTRIDGKISYSGLINENKNLVDICVWMAFNKMYHKYLTKLNLFAYGLKIEFYNIEQLLDHFYWHFKYSIKYIKENSEFYAKNPFIVNCMLVSNLDGSNNKGNEDITLVFLNSWGELYCEHYNASNIITAIEKIFSNYPILEKPFNEYFAFFIPRGAVASTVKIKQLIIQIYSHNYNSRWITKNNARHLISEYENKTYLFTSYNNNFFTNVLTSIDDYCKFINKQTDNFNHSKTFNVSVSYTLLGELFNNEERNLIQIFYFIYNSEYYVILSDIYNKLTIQKTNKSSLVSVIKTFLKKSQELLKKYKLELRDNFCLIKGLDSEIKEIKILANGKCLTTTRNNYLFKM